MSLSLIGAGRSGTDPREDFTTYTEADPQPCLTVTKHLVQAVGLDRAHDTWLYKDYTADHFQFFTHDVTFTVRSTVDHFGRLVFWAVANTVDDAKGWFDATSEALAVLVYLGSSGLNVGVYDYSTGASDHTYYGGTILDTPLYCKITHLAASPITLTLRGYSDEAGTNLLFTRAITVSAATKHRYVFGVDSDHDNLGASVWTADVANLILHE